MYQPPDYPYPAWRYGPDGQTCIVQTATDDEALGPEWVDNPGKVGLVTAMPPAMPDTPVEPDDDLLAVAADVPEPALVRRRHRKKLP